MPNDTSAPEQTRPIIFYGAGAEAQKRIFAWVDKGLVPVCFADADPNKHYRKFTATRDGNGETLELDILPLEAARKKYPEALIYVTLGRDKLRSVTDWLLEQGISKERIKYPDPVEWRRGCRFMGKEIYVWKMFRTCCGPRVASFPRTGDFAVDLQNYREHCTQMIRDVKEGKPTYCDGCVNLQTDFFEIDPKLSVIAIEDVGGAYCNVKCAYCETYPKPSPELLRQSHDEVMHILHDAVKVYDPKDLTILFCSGEITVAPFCDDAFNFIEEQGMKTTILTNGAVYKEKIAKLLREGRALVVVTLDSVNPETYAKCKGVDCGEKVLRNLEKYAATGGRFDIKWIVLEGMNDCRDEAAGIVDFAAKIGAHLHLTPDKRFRDRPMRENALAMCLFFLRYAREKGVPVNYIVKENFYPGDLQQIEAFQKKLWEDGK